MRRPAPLLIVVLTLVLWIVSGPVGMAFDGCATMGAMCEAPCGILSYVVAPGVVGLAVPRPLAYLEAPSIEQPVLISPSPLTPPPKFSLLSA